MNLKLIVGCAAIAVTTIACGGPSAEQKKQADQIAKGAQQAAAGAQQAAQSAGQAAAAGGNDLAKGLQQMAAGFQQMAQGSGTAVDYELLKPFLPELPGWEKKNARGEQVSMPMKMSHAEARYEKGDSTITLNITDSALNQLILAPITMFMTMGFEEKSDEGYKKAAQINGVPGYEEWRKEAKNGEVTAIVGNRFVVQAKGSNVENIDAVRKAVTSVDFAKLATLK